MSFFPKKMLSGPKEIQPLHFHGEIEEIDLWVLENMQAIIEHLAKGARIFQKNKTFSENGRYNPAHRSLSEMPLCNHAIRIYEKMEGFEIIVAGAGRLDMCARLTTNNTTSSILHTFAISGVDNIVVDFTFAQRIQDKTELLPGQRIDILESIVPELVFRPHEQLAILRGTLESINTSDTLIYSCKRYRK
jgi:hypothetical protein